MQTVDILALPIPTRPTYFGPDGAPPGVALALDTYETLYDGTRWLASRPTIKPICGVVHTNAANVEAHLSSQFSWGKRATNNTKPHYCINVPQPTKVLRSDLRSIANSTSSAVERAFGVADSSFWTVSIESADAGALQGLGGFLTESVHGDVPIPHAEIIARIMAYESIVHGFPVEVPTEFARPGWVTHTDPFGPYHFTTVSGKTCPGPQKKAEFYSYLIPRAKAIYDAWTAPDNPQEGHMIPTAKRVFNTIGGHAIPADSTVTVDVGPYKTVLVTLSTLDPQASGFLTAFPADGGRPLIAHHSYHPDTAGVTNSPALVKVSAAGTIKVYTRSQTHLVVDVQGYTS